MAGREFQMAFSIGARLQGQFGSAFKSAQSSVVALQSKIESLNKKQGDINAYTQQQAAVEKTRSKLELLQKQYDNVKNAMGKNGEANVDLQNKELRLRQQIESKNESLTKGEQKLQSMGNALNQAGVDTNNLAQESQKLSSQLETLKSEQEQAAQASEEMGHSMADSANAVAELAAAAGMIKVLQTGYEIMKECSQAAIEYESSMAAVKRTVGGSDTFLRELGDSFKELSTTIPISSGELAGIATTAGQLGIAQENVESFTTVMAKLATTTDLSADSAATMLAQFANITGLTDYERLGSVVAELGDATATTASKVVEMSQGMAASASQAGMSSVDIMAISAALGSLGIEAQAGSTSMSTLISTLYKAVETGEGLSEFASIANMTADQFKQAWGDNAVGALNSFIQGLNDTERNGKSAIVVLDELGITNVRQTKAILGLASAGNLLSNTLAQAGNAWNQNTALAAKASVMYETTEARLTMLNNATNNLKIAVGDALTPAIGASASALTELLKPITQFIQKNPAVIRAITAGVGVIALATAGVTGYAAVVRIATKLNGLFAASMTASLGPIMAITAGIAGVVAVAILLADAFKSNKESMEDLDKEFDDLNLEFRKQGEIRSLCAEYRNLKNELSSTTSVAQELDGVDVTTITLKAILKKEGFTNEDDIAVVTSFYNQIHTKTGFMLQILHLDGAEEVTKENLEKITDLGAKIASGEGALKQELSVLGADQVTESSLAAIKSLGSSVKSGTYKLLQTLGFKNPDQVTSADAALIVEMAAAVANGTGSLQQLLSLTGVETVSDDGIAKIKSLAAAIVNDAGILSQKLNLSDEDNVTFADILRISAMAAAIADDEGSLRQTLSLIGAKDITDEDIGKIVSLSDNIKSAFGVIWQKLGIEGVEKITDDDIEKIGSLHKSIADKKGELEQILKINGADQVTDESISAIVNLGDNIKKDSGVLLQVLGVTGADKITDDTLGKIQGLAAQIKTDNGKLTETLAVYGFEKYEQLKQACDLADKVKNADYQSNLGLTVDVTNAEQLSQLMSALQSEAAELKEKAETSKADLEAAKTDLAELERREGELENRLSGAKTESGKSVLQQQIEDQMAVIGKQKEKVSELETAYTEVAAQYTLTQAAAEELAAKEQRLADVKAQLSEATGGVISATASETEELEKQLQVQEKLAESRQAEIRQKVRSNATEQAKQYAEAIRTAASNQKALDNAVQQSARYQDYLHSGADGMKQAIYDAQAALIAIGREQGGIDWNTDEARAYAQQISEIWQLATGQGYDVRGRFVSLGYELERVDWSYIYENYDKLAISTAQYQQAVDEANAVQKMFIDNLVSGVQEGSMTMEDIETLLHNAFSDTANGAEIAEEAILQVKAALEDVQEAAAETGTDIPASAAEVNAAIQPILDNMTKLSEAYAEAYDAAYKSMGGQFKLFEKAPEVTKASMDEMIEGLKSQAQYMAEYTANLQELQGKGLNKELLASLSDGSAESAAAVAAMVDDIANNGSQKLDELNAAFESVQKGKDAFASTVAEMETDFAAKMQQLSVELAATVNTMDMSSEAASAGAATVQAFADGAKGKVSAVTAAFKAVADAAAAIFNFKIGGHAAGTESAERGFAWVGERGPELMWFNGGEQVMNAQDSRNFVRQATNNAEPVQAITDRRDSNYHIEVKPEFNITGGGNTADMETIMQQQTERMREMVEEVLSDIESDHVRSVYTK